MDHQCNSPGSDFLLNFLCSNLIKNLLLIEIFPQPQNILVSEYQNFDSYINWHCAFVIYQSFEFSGTSLSPRHYLFLGALQKQFLACRVENHTQPAKSFVSYCHAGEYSLEAIKSGHQPIPSKQL